MAIKRLPGPVTTANEAARRALGLTGDLLTGWAPGRVNLIGEHTDYNDGWVLPVAIERVVALAGQIRSEPIIRLYSTHHGETATFTLDRLPTAADPQEVPLWARYIAGAVGEARDEGWPLAGFDVAIAGDVPLGGGMSSSAALLIATLTWLTRAFDITSAPIELAQIAQRAEIRGSGVKVGILDQAASVLGMPGMATLIDCRTMDYRPIPIKFTDVALLICESGVERSLAGGDGKYNERVAECQEAVDAIVEALRAEGDQREIAKLRDVTHADFLRLAGHIAGPARQRARHIIAENARTLRAAEALEAGDAETFGTLVLESHASLRDDYAVSVVQLDDIVEIATHVPGVLGARLVGAGFGGGTLIVVREPSVAAVVEALATQYPERTGLQPEIHRVAPAGGPGTALVGEGL